jgi:Flp pilus assembly secretin CpaC
MSGISSGKNNRFQPVIVFLSFLAICAGAAQLSIRHSPNSSAMIAVPANLAKMQGPFFSINVQVVEVPVNLLPTLDIKPFDKTKLTANPQRVEKPFSTQIESLRKNKKLKVLAEPTLCIADGRRASFSSGGENSVVFSGVDAASAEFEKNEIRVGVMAKRQENGRINFAFSPEIIIHYFKKTVMVDGKSIPAILHSQRVNTGVEMEYGETVVLSNFTTTPQKDKNSHQILFVAKVEKFDPR